MRRTDERGAVSTRARLVALLRRGRRSVEELAAALGLTDNAVRAQLQTLQREGIARAAEQRRDGSVGKPATLYDIEPAAEPAFSRAYAPVLTALLAELRKRGDAGDVEVLLRRVGRDLAAEAASGPTARPEVRARRALAVLSALGGEADLERTPDGFAIRGHGCPLSAAVCVEPNVCAAVEELVGAVAGAPVREHCDRTGERPRCSFHIAVPAA
ncbi:regulatory protein ArsR [Gemmatirosa kalamazoonensis]|uniref:Regulatory protein ArsR n=1 Tax=Gemmatirosa kalamazoonensis TaxID=861299 RepID=W0RBA1_9BACT|nr:ArsR family transcriptional regulator [Gemmatirosa kalamazoonensis]AHG88374.1 regulatory protein ArsR [Gemmatirosa kalamazoonensis]